MNRFRNIPEAVAEQKLAQYKVPEQGRPAYMVKIKSARYVCLSVMMLLEELKYV
jgi:hypothetical protein